MFFLNNLQLHFEYMHMKISIYQEDRDGDRVGDECDNCVDKPNPKQVLYSFFCYLVLIKYLNMIHQFLD